MDAVTTIREDLQKQLISQIWEDEYLIGNVIEDYVKIITNYQKKRNVETNKYQDPTSKLNKDSIKTIIDGIDNNFKSISYTN